jgi:hypothetical protein
MLELLLRREGWDVTYLGADVPIEGIKQTVESTRPHLVILSAQQLRTAANLLDMAHALQQDGVAVAFGGGVFNWAPALRERIPGHFLGSTLQEATRETENLMMSAHQTPGCERPTEAYERVLSCCLDQLLMLEASAWTALEPVEFDRNALLELNAEFVRVVVAALKLGDVGLVGDYLDWLDGMDAHMRVPSEVLDRYLEAYRQAAENHLGERGALIINWLDGRMLRDAKLQASG